MRSHHRLILTVELAIVVWIRQAAVKRMNKALQANKVVRPPSMPPERGAVIVIDFRKSA